MEKLDFLITYLLKERNEKLDLTELSYEDKKRIFRSLCNLREPEKTTESFLRIQDMYLQEEIKEKGITENIEDSKMKDKIYLWKGDITTLKIDAIVNAANSQGLGCFIPCHKCIDNQINTYAGIELRLECNEVMKKRNYFLHTGEAFITKGYNLPAKYIIHTVGPIIEKNVTKDDEKALANCYINSLELAIKNNIKTIAFPCISTGEFRFPKVMASKIAITTVNKFLDKYSDKFEKIVFNVFGEEDYEIYETNLRKGKEFN